VAFGRSQFLFRSGRSSGFTPTPRSSSTSSGRAFAFEKPRGSHAVVPSSSGLEEERRPDSAPTRFSRSRAASGESRSGRQQRVARRAHGRSRVVGLVFRSPRTSCCIVQVGDQPDHLCGSVHRFRAGGGSRRGVAGGRVRTAPAPLGSGFLAGKCFMRYRRAGGRRGTPLPDLRRTSHCEGTRNENDERRSHKQRSLLQRVTTQRLLATLCSARRSCRRRTGDRSPGRLAPASSVP
jgi:hypothetical protein